MVIWIVFVVGTVNLNEREHTAPPSGTYVRNAWRLTSSPSVLMVVFVIKHRNNFTLHT